MVQMDTSVLLNLAHFIHQTLWATLKNDNETNNNYNNSALSFDIKQLQWTRK
jgi:hypothetical protein